MKTHFKNMVNSRKHVENNTNAYITCSMYWILKVSGIRDGNVEQPPSHPVSEPASQPASKPTCLPACVLAGRPAGQPASSGTQMYCFCYALLVFSSLLFCFPCVCSCCSCFAQKIHGRRVVDAAAPLLQLKQAAGSFLLLLMPASAKA